MEGSEELFHHGTSQLRLDVFDLNENAVSIQRTMRTGTSDRGTSSQLDSRSERKFSGWKKRRLHHRRDRHDEEGGRWSREDKAMRKELRGHPQGEGRFTLEHIHTHIYSLRSSGLLEWPRPRGAWPLNIAAAICSAGWPY